MKHTKVRIYGDETHCEDCGKRWDTNDPSPPPCNPVKRSPFKFRISVASNGYEGPGRYTYYDVNSSWQYVTEAPSLREANRNARKSYAEFKKTNYGQLEIVAGPKK